MSRGNVEIVRQAFDALNRGAIEEMFEAAADDLVMDWSNSMSPLRGVYDDVTLVVANHVRMRGRASGVEVEVTGAHLWTFRDGQATSIKHFQTKDDALVGA